jgi:hypothetical protein
MSELASKVEELVRISLPQPKRVKDWELGNAVRAVMAAYDNEDTKGIKTSIKLLDAGLQKAKEERAQEILRLALGVLVEAGAPAELAWPTAERGFMETLKLATRYADIALDEQDTPSITEAIRFGGHPFELEHPKEFAAWKSLQSRALLAVACVAHSAKLRAHVMKNQLDLVNACEGLELDIEPLLFFRQLARVLPDQTMLAIHPGQRRGVRVEVKEVATNLELYVLLADAVLGDPKKGFIEGRRPNAKAIKMVTDPTYAPKENPEVTLPFHLSNWTVVNTDGTLPDPADQRPQNWIGYEGVPLEIMPFEGERVLLFQKPMMPRALPVEGTFDTLTPRVTVKSKLSGSEIDALLLRMGKAAVKVNAKAIAEEEAFHLRERKKWEAMVKRAQREQAKKKAARKKR